MTRLSLGSTLGSMKKPNPSLWQQVVDTIKGDAKMSSTDGDYKRVEQPDCKDNRITEETENLTSQTTRDKMQQRLLKPQKPIPPSPRVKASFFFETPVHDHRPMKCTAPSHQETIINEDGTGRTEPSRGRDEDTPGKGPAPVAVEQQAVNNPLLGQLHQLLSTLSHREKCLLMGFDPDVERPVETVAGPGGNYYPAQRRRATVGKSTAKSEQPDKRQVRLHEVGTGVQRNYVQVGRSAAQSELLQGNPRAERRNAP